jgi:hypothetical protein
MGGWKGRDGDGENRYCLYIEYSSIIAVVGWGLKI